MLIQDVKGTQAWTGPSFGNAVHWIQPLSEALLNELRSCLREHPTSSPPTDLRLTAPQRRAWGQLLASTRSALEQGCGFVVLDRLPMEELSVREATGLYWLIGQLIGEPFVQNVQGTLLYDVRDTGQSLTSGARFSVTNYESSFHTDNSFGDTVLDYVGLLCLQPAKSGGLSQHVSGYSAHNILLQESPDILHTLYEDFFVDRRGGVREGETETVRRPIFSYDGELLVRYLRYWIEVGHEKAGRPLSPQQEQALDVLDGTLQRPELRVEFALRPGQIYFLNNRWILHNRTAFTDDPQQRRHLVRLWLQRDSLYDLT